MRLILLGDLVPGSAVRERNMAEFLGIRRKPLREAVQQLAVEGLIEYSATRRPFVANPTIEDIRGCMTVMAALEALAGEQACLNVTDAEINQISALHERMMKTSGRAFGIQVDRVDRSCGGDKEPIALGADQPRSKNFSQDKPLSLNSLFSCP